MSIPRSKVPDWTLNEEVTTDQINNLDKNTTYGIDKRKNFPDQIKSTLGALTGSSFTFEEDSFFTIRDPSVFTISDGYIKTNAIILGDEQPLSLGLGINEVLNNNNANVIAPFHSVGNFTTTGQIDGYSRIITSNILGFSKVIDNRCTGDGYVVFRQFTGEDAVVYNGFCNGIYSNGANLVTYSYQGYDIISQQEIHSLNQFVGTFIQSNITENIILDQASQKYLFLTFTDCKLGDIFDITLGSTIANGYPCNLRVRVNNAATFLNETVIVGPTTTLSGSTLTFSLPYTYTIPFAGSESFKSCIRNTFYINDSSTVNNFYIMLTGYCFSPTNLMITQYRKINKG